MAYSGVCFDARDILHFVGSLVVTVVVALCAIVVLYVSVVWLNMSFFGAVPTVLFMSVIAWWLSRYEDYL